MTKKKISFCIPNFNRGSCLVSLFESVRELSELDQSLDIELCVSDNASSDDSVEIIDEYVKDDEFPEVKLHRCGTNQGFQTNLLNCLKMATGDYCWIMGSDDSIDAENFHAFTVELFNAGSVDMALTNRTLCDQDLNQQTVDEYFEPPRPSGVVNFKNTETIETWLSQAKSVNALGCFISSIAFSKEFSQEFISLATTDEQYQANIFPHVFVIWKLISSRESTRLYYYNKPCVNWRGANSSFSVGEAFKCADLLRIIPFIKDKGKVRDEFKNLIFRQYARAIGLRVLLENNFFYSISVTILKAQGYSIYAIHRMYILYRAKRWLKSKMLRNS